ncbi:cation:proton antiporter, partial [Parabacteroides sp. OttesenSCG-928-O15]|nr:cation:proton antiporter [Parabacteroides sp. OttesenSCG-928-O15]
IEHLVEPIKTFFGAIFFVSVGMMLDPNVIVEYAVLIVILTLVVLVGRIIFATLGVLASGEGLKVAIQAGFSLAQIGEFSFIIATLGNSLGVISNTLYPIIVAVSIITTFTTPYCIRLSTPIYNWIEKHTPANLTRLLEGYASSNLKTVNKRTHWNRLLRSILQFTAIYATVSLAVIYLSEYFVTPFILENVPDIWGRLLAATITLILMAPFLRAIMMKKNRSEEFKSLWEDNHFNRGALISLIVLRVVICIGLTMMVLTPLFPNATVWLWVISGGVVTCIIFFQGFKTQSRRMEARFLENLNQKQLFEEKRAPIHPKIANALLSKDIHLEEIDVSPSSPKIGKTLRDLDLRSRYGVNVVSIIRGNQKINIPDANERIYPYDKMIVAGSDEDIQNMTKVIADRAQVEIPEEEPVYQISLSQYVVEPGSPLIGETIQSMNIQNQTECMIINIERDDVSIIHIYPDFMFEEGDTLLLAGEKEKLNAFEENLGLRPPFIGILHTDTH